MRTKLISSMHVLEHASSQRAFVVTMRETHRAPNAHLTDGDVRDAEDAMEEQRELEYRAAEFTGIVAARGLGDIDDDALDDEIASMYEAEAVPHLPALPEPVRTPPRHGDARGARSHTGLAELADYM